MLRNTRIYLMELPDVVRTARARWVRSDMKKTIQSQVILFQLDRIQTLYPSTCLQTLTQGYTLTVYIPPNLIKSNADLL